jgi:hypothetical protein
VFPITKPIFKLLGRAKDETAESERLLHGHDEEGNKKSKKNKKKEGLPQPEEGESDPLNFLGFGMIAYRDLMFTMFLLFALMSVIMLPAMVFYSGQGAIAKPKTFAAPISIGAFGYSSTQCQVTPFQLQSLPINCPYGTLGKVVSAGIIPSGSQDYQRACNTEALSDAIKTKCPLKANLVAEVQASLKLGVDKQRYSITDKYSLMVQDAQHPIDASCTDENAKVFVQFECHQSAEQLSTKREQAAMVSSLAVLLVCVYLIVLHYFKRSSALNQMEWDVQTLTPGDYTAQYEITEKAYNFFLNVIYPNEKERGKSIGIALKEYLKRELENVLTHKLKELKEKPGSDNLKCDEVKIADIVFAFNNSQLINLLKLRGQHIMFQRYDKMREVEAQITTLKNEKFDSLVRPVDAFITFEEEDGLIVAQEFEPEFNFMGKQLPAQKEFMDDELFLHEATEPTNIIWENRHWTPADYAKRTLQVVAIIYGLLVVSFLAIYTCKSIAIDNAKKYPPVDAITIFKEIFENDASKLMKYAEQEYKEFVDHETPLAGYYQTYCILSSPSQSEEWK